MVAMYNIAGRQVGSHWVRRLLEIPVPFNSAGKRIVEAKHVADDI